MQDAQAGAAALAAADKAAAVHTHLRELRSVHGALVLTIEESESLAAADAYAAVVTCGVVGAGMSEAGGEELQMTQMHPLEECHAGGAGPNATQCRPCLSRQERKAEETKLDAVLHLHFASRSVNWAGSLQCAERNLLSLSAPVGWPDMPDLLV